MNQWEDKTLVSHHHFQWNFYDVMSITFPTPLPLIYGRGKSSMKENGESPKFGGWIKVRKFFLNKYL